THSIANNLFPIEVYLGHLLEIGRREGLGDAALAAERALANLEKAKLQVERFKSLAAETAPRPSRVDLLAAVVERVDYMERCGASARRRAVEGTGAGGRRRGRPARGAGLRAPPRGVGVGGLHRQ